MNIEDFNNTEVKDFSALKPGEYPVNIQTIEVKTSKAGNRMIVIVSELENGALNFNHLNIENSNPNVVNMAVQEIKKLLRAFGLKDKFESIPEMLTNLTSIAGKNATLIVKWTPKKTAEKDSKAEDDHYISFSYLAPDEGAFAQATVVQGTPTIKETVVETIEGLDEIVKSNKEDITVEEIVFESNGSVTKKPI